MSDRNTIFVKDMELDISIGVNESERLKKQRVLINVSADLEIWPDPVHDNIDEALSYIVIVDHILRLTKDRHINLVETLAEDIAQACLGHTISKVKVRVEKPDIYPHATLGVEITRSK